MQRATLRIMAIAGCMIGLAFTGTHLLLAVLIGMAVGIIAGLLPGVHPNLVASIIGSLALSLIMDGLWLAAFLVAVGITHIIIEIIPSVFLSAPESDLADAVLPAQRLVQKGAGCEAVRLALTGAVCGIALTMLALPLFVYVLPRFYRATRAHLWWALPLLALGLIWQEKTWVKRAWAACVFALAGILGIIVLNTGLHNPLMPMLSGLFGMPGLLSHLRRSTPPPAQYETQVLRLPWREEILAISAGVFAGLALMLFPGAGPSQAGRLSMRFARGRISQYGFITLLGSLAAGDFVASLGAMVSIHKARSGILEEAGQWLFKWNTSTLWSLGAVILLCAGVAVLLALWLSKLCGNHFHHLPHRAVALSAMVLLAGLSYALNSVPGVIVLITASIIGLLAPWRGIARSHAMGCLLVPTISYFWF